jgi:hypothetical protein
MGIDTLPGAKVSERSIDDAIDIFKGLYKNGLFVGIIRFAVVVVSWSTQGFSAYRVARSGPAGHARAVGLSVAHQDLWVKWRACTSARDHKSELRETVKMIRYSQYLVECKMIRYKRVEWQMANSVLNVLRNGSARPKTW